nr:hypothetical protein GCM10020092_047900 [Actinoplanes digitatis]
MPSTLTTATVSGSVQRAATAAARIAAASGPGCTSRVISRRRVVSPVPGVAALLVQVTLGRGTGQHVGEAEQRRREHVEHVRRQVPVDQVRPDVAAAEHEDRAQRVDGVPLAVLGAAEPDEHLPGRRQVGARHGHRVRERVDGGTHPEGEPPALYAAQRSALRAHGRLDGRQHPVEELAPDGPDLLADVGRKGGEAGLQHGEEQALSPR